MQIGNVIGIGGGAWLGLKAADKNKGEDGTVDKIEDQKKANAWTEHKRVKEAKNALKGLLEGSVVR